MCPEKHIHPLVQALQSKGVVVELLPNFKDEIQISPVCYTGRLLADVLVRVLRAMPCLSPCSFLLASGLWGSLLRYVAGGVLLLQGGCTGVGLLALQVAGAGSSEASTRLPMFGCCEQDTSWRTGQAIFWYDLFHKHPWRRPQFDLPLSSDNCHGSLKFCLLFAPGLRSIPGCPSSRSPSNSRHDGYPA